MGIRVGGEGEQPQRFVVPVEYLSHPLFVGLLKEAEDEYGFHHQGAITIPCRVKHFRRIQSIIDRDCSQAAATQHLTGVPRIRSISPRRDLVVVLDRAKRTGLIEMWFAATSIDRFADIPKCLVERRAAHDSHEGDGWLTNREDIDRRNSHHIPLRTDNSPEEVVEKCSNGAETTCIAFPPTRNDCDAALTSPRSSSMVTGRGRRSSSCIDWRCLELHERYLCFCLLGLNLIEILDKSVLRDSTSGCRAANHGLA
ncbi:hypothetical protein B296_00016466 [Ensete ventricosum]|uniref:Auxin-responsive protein n=1 Tax=Ensete ventricosum TaxID=4639 RepID=A0A426ZG30_ENSVE|nr:hypothetical protein B296_00016466 [Ensete ventricosum]